MKKAIQGTAMDSDMPDVKPGLLNNVNGARWGFLSSCVSSEADTVFKTAGRLQGIDAWRLIVRYIEDGKDLKLELMRDDMKVMHLKPIKNLESVAAGIAEFELKFNEYNEAGGTMPPDAEKTTDLLNLLPTELTRDLLCRARYSGAYAPSCDTARA